MNAIHRRTMGLMLDTLNRRFIGHANTDSFRLIFFMQLLKTIQSNYKMLTNVNI